MLQVLKAWVHVTVLVPGTQISQALAGLMSLAR